MISRIFILSCFFIITGLSYAQVVVEHLNLEGNEKTKDFVIKRELLFEEGQVYNLDTFLEVLIPRSEERLMNLNLFNKVEITAMPEALEQGPYTVVVKLVEKWYIWPIPTVEFADRNFNIWADSLFDPSRSNYGLYLFNYNLFGRNHTLKTSIIGGYNTKLGFEYRIPFLSQTSNYGLETKISYQNQDELWARTENNVLQFYNSDQNDFVQHLNAEAFLTRRLSLPWSVKAGLSFQRIAIDSAALNESQQYLLNNAVRQNRLGLEIQTAYDKRDNIYLPLQGLYLEAVAAAQEIRSTGQLTNIRLAGRAQRFIKMNPSLFSAFSLFGEYNSNGQLPYRYRRMLGYDHFLRGYENYVIDGTRGFLVNAALRYRFINKTYPMEFIPVESYSFLPVQAFIEFFVDAGGAYNNVPDRMNDFQNSVLYSTGFSLQTLFYNDRVVRFEYSLNAARESGFYIHFEKAI